MSESSESAVAEIARRMRGNGLHRRAIECPGNFHADVARVRWPKKTAHHWAVASGVKERMAKYWLAGTHPVSDAGKLALIRELQ